MSDKLHSDEQKKKHVYFVDKVFMDPVTTMRNASDSWYFVHAMTVKLLPVCRFDHKSCQGNRMFFFQV